MQGRSRESRHCRCRNSLPDNNFRKSSTRTPTLTLFQKSSYTPAPFGIRRQLLRVSALIGPSTRPNSGHTNHLPVTSTGIPLVKFPAFRPSTLWALLALALMVCTGIAVKAQTPLGAGHSQPSLSRVERALLQPIETGPPIARHSGPLTAQKVESPPPSGPRITDPITISSQYAWKWEEGGQEVVFTRGHCVVTQGATELTANEMVFWGSYSESDQEAHLSIYMDGDAKFSDQSRTSCKPYMMAELATRTSVKFEHSPVDRSMADSPTYQRGHERRRANRSQLLQTQFIESTPSAPTLWNDSEFDMGSIGTPQLLPRRVSIEPRYVGTDFKVRSDVDRTKQPPESITTVQGGVHIIVQNVPLTVNGQLVLTSIGLKADRAIIWTSAEGLGAGAFELNENTPFQVYLEGDIEVQQGNTRANASHAFFDIRDRRGLLMNSELRTYLPEYDTTLRVRADSIRQMSETSFQAQNAWVTTSQLGQPGYRLQSDSITIQDRPSSWGGVDPSTGQPITSSYVTASGNRLFVEEMPIFYLPRVSGPVEETPFPLESAGVGFSRMFGAEINTVWGVDKLFGFDLPRGVDWDLLVDGYTRRGPAVGTRGNYDLYGTMLGLPTHVTGEGLLYYVHDTGTDRLGLGRNDLAFPDPNRGRALLRNRMEFPFGVTLTNEFSYIFNNDRNFLEQYYEPEYDRGKDQENYANLVKQNDNVTASLLFQTKLNTIFDQTEWLPRLDVTMLGEPILGGPVTWSNHSYVGYGHIKPAAAPTDPADTFDPLPYFPDVQGLVASTRHEVTLPFNIGPVKVAPYALGEAAYWQQDMAGNDLSRLYGSAGVRASVEFWRVVPELQNAILGLNGLAHKVVFDADYSYSRSTASLSDIPQYNAFDEDAQERFRERFLDLSFGGALPAQFDPRFYAVRTGAGQSVTAAYNELVGNQQVLRLGMRQRWQTKEGPFENPRIRDWMSLDLEASLFPNNSRDNFGSTLGLLTGHYMWQVGERTQFLANAVVDPFHNGQRVWNAGVLTQRGPRGSLYVGLREIMAGPVDSQLLTASYSYRMSEKWISTLGASYDIAERRDRGQSLTITRIGEYMLFHLGTGYDRSRNNFSLNFMIEPRLGNKTTPTQMSSLIGSGPY